MPIRFPLLIILCVAALGADLLRASPVISEFMASNVTTLKDGHDHYEDWIEIWNPDPSPVDLASWRLTDSAANPAKFIFPTKVIPAGGRLIVFASNRAGSSGATTHVDPLGYLHTNFSLSKSGEYLALVQPDGVTKTTEFAPAYPVQVDDISYGPPGTSEEIVNSGTSVRYLVPTSGTPDTANPNWRAANYADGSWTSAVGSGVGFEAGSPVGVWPLDEGAGATSAGDTSGNGFSAAINGTGVTFGAAGHSALTNTAVSLNGSGGLTVPYSSKLNPASTFTFAAWVFPTAGGSYRSVVTSRYGAGGAQRGFILYISPSNSWEFWTGTGSAWDPLSGPAVNLNTWTHVAIARTASGAKRIYVNGVQVASASGGYAPNNVAADGFHIGCGDDAGTNFRFAGRIDDAAFFPSDLGTLLVQQHMNSGAGSFSTPLYPAHFQTDVQAAMFGIQSGIYTRHNFTVADKTRYASLRLRMKYDDAFVAFLNGTEIARRNFTGTRAFNSVADSDRADTSAITFENIDVTAAAQPVMVNGANTLAIHGLTRSTAHGDFLLTPVFDATLTPSALATGYFAVPTPGAANSIATVNPGPAISGVSHAPAAPTAATPITVTARITPRLAPIAVASLKYRVMYGADSAAVAMTDAGPVPGATDGSRIFTGTIPPTHGASARQMLRYFVSATDTSARTWREPYVVDLTNGDSVSQSPEYFGLVIADPALVAGMPILQWFTNDVPNSDTRTGSRASASYGGVFYDNIYVRQRGGFTSTGSQKFNFNAGYGVFVNAALGTVGEVNLNSAGLDSSYLRMALGFDLYRTGGHPACDAFPVALYRNGSFQRMATLIEQVDEDFLKRRGFDNDGALYKFVQRTGETPLAGGDYSNSPAFGDTLYGIEKKTRLYEGLADLNGFVTGLNTGTNAQRTAHLFKNLNIPNYVNFMALRSLVAEIDVNRKNFYFYRDSDGSLEWYLFPWDKDMTMGIGYDTSTASNRANPWQSTNTFKHDPGATNQWCVLWEQGYQSPEIRAMVGRRLRTLMNGMLGTPGLPIPGTTLMEQRLEAMRALMTPLPTGVSVSGYRDRTSFNTWLGQHRTSLYTTYGPSSGFNMIPNAPAVAPNVAIQSADPNPASGTQDLEQLLLVNNGLEDVDLTGWTLSGGGISLHTFASGTVIPGAATTATLNRAYVCNNRAAWRARAGAPTGAEFVLGNYDGQLSARGGTVELRDSAGAVRSTFSLPVAPTIAQRDLRISKVMYAPLAPTLSELAAMPTVDAGDFEYIELHNIGIAPLVLDGCRFTDGCDFIFPPGTTLAAGARLCVVANTDAFELRYGGEIARVGPFIGSLDNAGERLRIVDAVGEEVLDFAYSSAWFPASDSAGYALVIRDDLSTSYADWALPEKWALSSTPGGLPGQMPAYFSYEYAGWKNYVFTSAERNNPAVSGPAVVLNNSGLSNALCFALGLDPRAPDSSAMPRATLMEIGGQQFPALRFRRWKSAPGATYLVESTATIGNGASWLVEGTTASAVDNGDSSETVTIRATSTGSPRYFRLKVSLP